LDGRGRERRFPGGGSDSPGKENLGEFLRRYAESPEEKTAPERNYLAFRFRGKPLVIAELPLILGFLGLGALCFAGLLFLPPAKRKDPPRRIRRIPAALIPWLCMITITTAALYRLSIYPLLAPALLPAFAGRSLRPSFPRRICMAAAVFYLAAALLASRLLELFKNSGF
jgi:hypothetical protein